MSDEFKKVPAKSPSFWITTLHLTMQFVQLNGMWVPVSFDPVATIRFLGEYTLAGLNIPSAESPSTVPKIAMCDNVWIVGYPKVTDGLGRLPAPDKS